MERCVGVRGSKGGAAAGGGGCTKRDGPGGGGLEIDYPPQPPPNHNCSRGGRGLLLKVGHRSVWFGPPGNAEKEKRVVVVVVVEFGGGDVLKWTPFVSDVSAVWCTLGNP